LAILVDADSDLGLQLPGSMPLPKIFGEIMALISLFLVVQQFWTCPLTPQPLNVISSSVDISMSAKWMVFFHAAPSSGRALEFHRYHQNLSLPHGSIFHCKVMGFSLRI
jgi:hypothetical protein